MWLYTFVFDYNITLLVCGVLVGKAVLRQHFSVPTVEHLFAEIGKAKFFCSLDAAPGF